MGRPDGCRDRTATMAIYHFRVEVLSRSNGDSAVAAAAYRAGQALFDERYGVVQDYSRKGGVLHAEILAPAGAPAWVFDRETLWNRVEAGEKREDAQLARQLIVALPVELSPAEGIELVRDFVQREFVAEGMVADFAVHRDDPNNPHAHVLLSMRALGPAGFGGKVRAWNAKSALLGWRAAWAERSNAHLARAGHAVRIDHRTLEAQGIELVPGRKIGVGRDRQAQAGLPRHVAERIAEQERIAGENGESILADPGVALAAITRERATFTHHDLARFLHTRTAGAAQFQAAFLKVTSSAELVALGRDEAGRRRYTTRDMLAAEAALYSHARVLAGRRGHGVEGVRQRAVLAASVLSEEQRQAFAAITAAGDLQAIVGVAGSGKSTLLATARAAWEAEGLTVKGAALSGIAAQKLEVAAGIRARTLASFEHAWNAGREALGARDVLVIDEAGMIGTRQLERVLQAATRAQAKVVLVGDPEQLQAIEAGAAFRGILGQAGVVELTEVRRQHAAWARQATQQLASGATAAAIAAYGAHGAVHATLTEAEARAALLEAWRRDGERTAQASRLILAYTREDVRALNHAARELRATRGELPRPERIETARGAREFAAGDRILCLRNEKSLGVKNGSLGTVERIERGVLAVRLDGAEAARVVIDSRDYADLDHGYAVTVHKAQGATVDRTYVLASRYFDRHTSYVALSRHREAAQLFYSSEEFAGRVGSDPVAERSAEARLISVLARARPKELAHDYLELEAAPALGARSPTRPQPSTDSAPDPAHPLADVDARQRDAALRWKAGLEQSRERGATPERTPGPEAARSPPRPRRPRGPQIE